MSTTPTVSMSERQFNDMRDAGRMKADVAYTVTHYNRIDGDTEQYAYSPDGVGCFWYDKIEYLMYEHGTTEDWQKYSLTDDGYAKWQVIQDELRA